MQIAVDSSSLKRVALTIRAHFYLKPGKIITNRYNCFLLLTNLKEKVKIDLLEKINYFKYIYNIFILSLTVLGLKSPVTGLIDYWYNWNEWSEIWSEIIRVISKSNRRAERVSLVVKSMISDQNCITQSSVTTLLHPFSKRKIQSLKYRIFQLVFENIILIQYCFLVGFGKDAIKSKKGAIRDLIVVPMTGKQFNLQGSPAISKWVKDLYNYIDDDYQHNYRSLS